MNPVPQTHSDEKLIRLLRADHALNLENAPREHSQRTPQCPSLPRFQEARRHGWTDEERRHIFEGACPYCRKVLAMFDRAEADNSPDEPAGATDAEDSGQEPTDVGAGNTRLAWTGLARSGRFPELLGELTPWIPWLLQSVRLPETLAGQFLDYLRQVLPNFDPSRRIRDVMPGWLIGFARQHAPEVAVDPEQVRLDVAFIRAGAVDLALSRSDEGETPWAAQVRSYLRDQHLRVPDEMLTVSLPEELASNPLEIPYRQALYRNACRLEQEGLSALEIRVAA